MKIALNAGHTPTSPGASDLLDEVGCNRPLRNNTANELRERGHSVYDCTAPDDMEYPSELNEQCRLANISGADIAVSLHLNAGGGTGPEVLYWRDDAEGEALAAMISANLAAALGLPDRGPKSRDNLGFLNNTDMTAVIVEACFVDRSEDRDAWHRTSWHDIACAIADGIEGKAWTKSEPSPAPEPSGTCSGNIHHAKKGDTVLID